MADLSPYYSPGGGVNVGVSPVPVPAQVSVSGRGNISQSASGQFSAGGEVVWLLVFVGGVLFLLHAIG
jgi:hypothetical protein